MLKTIKEEDHKVFQIIWQDENPIESLKSISDKELFVARAHEGSTVLMAAVARKNKKLSQAILKRLDESNLNNDEKKVFLNQFDNKHRNAMHIAIKRGKLKIFDSLLQYGEIDINARDHRGYSTLQCAVTSGNYSAFDMAKKIVENKAYRVIQKGEDIQTLKVEGETSQTSDLAACLLMYSEMKQNTVREKIFAYEFYAMVRTLVNKGENVLAEFYSGSVHHNNLFMAQEVDGLDTTILLLNHGVCYDQKATLLADDYTDATSEAKYCETLALRMTRYEMEMIDARSDRYKDEHNDLQDKHILMKYVDRMFNTVKNGTFEQLKEILVNNPYPRLGVNLHTIENHDSLLHLACQRNDAEGWKMVSELINRGADTHYKNSQGMTALAYLKQNTYVHNATETRLKKECHMAQSKNPMRQFTTALQEAHCHKLAITLLRDARDQLYVEQLEITKEIAKNMTCQKADKPF